VCNNRPRHTERAEDVSQLGGIDEALSLAVIGLERFHEVGERTRVRLATHSLVDRQNLFKPVLLFACIHVRYDTRCYFNVRSKKAEMSQLNLPHGTNN